MANQCNVEAGAGGGSAVATSPIVRNWRQKLLHEIKVVGLVTLYFAFCFGILMLLKRLILAQYQIGFRGLSTFGRRRERPLRGLLEINTHVDLVDWKGTRCFVGEQAALGALVGALAHARTVSQEPVGLLSHHLAMDAEAWDFLRSMWEEAQKMPGLCIRSARELWEARA